MQACSARPWSRPVSAAESSFLRGDRVEVDLAAAIAELVADHSVLGQAGFVVTHAADFVGRRLEVLVRHQDDFDVAAGLDVCAASRASR